MFPAQSRSILFGLLAAWAVFEGGCRKPTEASVIRVAAASDLTRAFQLMGEAFEQKTGKKVIFTFGSTGLLTKQIEEGAPFDLFAAAATSYVDEVVAHGVCDASTRSSYGRGRLAAWSKDPSFAVRDLRELADPRFRRIAIANPEHAPYGKAAREALEKLGVWSQIEPRVVLGENVRQALELAETGNVEVAIISLSLVIHGEAGQFNLVPESAHAPIEQALVVCDRGESKSGGRAFAEFVGSDKGREILRAEGFLLPGDASPLASAASSP